MLSSWRTLMASKLEQRLVKLNDPLSLFRIWTAIDLAENKAAAFFTLVSKQDIVFIGLS